MNRSDLFVHLFLLFISVGVIAVSFCLRADDQQGIFVPGSRFALPPLCSSRLLLGIECPGCGLTRAFVAISHGRIQRAWELNRASMLMYAFVLAQIPWHLIQAWRVSRGRPPMFWSIVNYVPIALAILLVLNWMFKLAGY